MGWKRNGLRGLAALIAVLWTALVLAPAQAAVGKVAELRRQAEACETKGQWAKACDFYDSISPRERTLADIKHHLLCLRHVNQERRHRDASFRQQVLNQRIAVALKLYSEVLAKIQANYVDKEKVNLTRLFQQGLDELRMALSDGAFLHEYLPAANRKLIRTFRTHLAEVWQDKIVKSRADAQATVREVALAAQKTLGLKPTIVVLEFACGACNALDEFTAYLTPSQLQDLYASLKGEFVGIGIEVKVEDQHVLIAQVLMGSPAALSSPPLKEHDRILRIDKKTVANLSEEAINERLKGEAGTTVELEVFSPGDKEPRPLVLTRQPVTVHSVVGERMLDMGIGYFQLTGFQETTVQEMDEAIRRLTSSGMKVLVLDLRGNQGGLFSVAIQVAERFLSEGLIVSTQSQVQTENKKYEANNVSALGMPLVVLIDGDTASAAEVVAGAFKDNHRATLVGETTFGKGSIQQVLKLDTVPSGLRITLAKFFSPHGQAYSGYGVVPDVLVERASEFRDDQFLAAVDKARQLVMSP